MDTIQCKACKVNHECTRFKLTWRIGPSPFSEQVYTIGQSTHKPLLLSVSSYCMGLVEEGRGGEEKKGREKGREERREEGRDGERKRDGEEEIRERENGRGKEREREKGEGERKGEEGEGERESELSLGHPPGKACIQNQRVG